MFKICIIFVILLICFYIYSTSSGQAEYQKYIQSGLREVLLHSKDEEAHKDEDDVASELSEKVRVLCWIMTAPQYHKSRVIPNI